LNFIFREKKDWLENYITINRAIIAGRYGSWKFKRKRNSLETFFLAQRRGNCQSPNIKSTHEEERKVKIRTGERIILSQTGERSRKII